MDPRISFVTLAVTDPAATRRFYVDGLGWQPEVEVDGEVMMIRVAERLILSLWDRDYFEAEVGARAATDGVPAFTLAHNVGTPEQVDVVLAEARVAGASVVAAGEQRAWGGYTGYFADPDGFRWEVAYNPGELGDSVLPPGGTPIRLNRSSNPTEGAVMSDQKQKLSEVEVREAGLDDWRQILSKIRARFATGDFATGLALVDRIGAAAEAADHHPDITLTYPEVIVTLSSHDVDGITSRDIDLARTISGYAAEAGIGADVSGLTQLELGLDTSSSERLAPFYAALLGGEVRHGEPVDPSGQVPTVWWQEPDGDGPDLPPLDHEQRWHFDVWVPHDEAESRLAAVLAAGGTLVSDAAAPGYWVVADADGNRSCICTSAGR